MLLILATSGGAIRSEAAEYLRGVASGTVPCYPTETLHSIEITDDCFIVIEGCSGDELVPLLRRIATWTGGKSQIVVAPLLEHVIPQLPGLRMELNGPRFRLLPVLLPLIAPEELPIMLARHFGPLATQFGVLYMPSEPDAWGVPDRPTSHCSSGWELLRHGELGAALSQFQAALQLDQTDPYAWVAIGQILWFRGECKRAAAAFKMAAQKGALTFRLLFELAYILEKLGLFEHAAEIYGDLLTPGLFGTGDESWIRVGYARVLLTLGLWDEAKREWSRLLVEDGGFYRSAARIVLAELSAITGPTDL